MTDKPKDGGPAFPGKYKFPRSDPTIREGETIFKSGMSLRQWYAAHSPQMPEQWWIDSKSDNPKGYCWAEAQAAWAFRYADAMIAEGEK